MSTVTPTLPPNPSLLAILLVIRTRSGQPRLVFHYPPNPSLSNTTQTAPPAHASWYGGASTGAEGDESSSEQSSDSDDDTRSASASQTGSEVDHGEDKRSKSGSWRRKRNGSRQRTVDSVKSGRGPGAKRDIDDEIEGGSDENNADNDIPSEKRTGGADGDESGSYRPLDWERVLAFDGNALSKLLSPGRAFNKRRFEIGIDNLVFLGTPMFAREDGTWKKHKKHKPKLKKRPSSRNLEELTGKQLPDGLPGDSDSGVDIRNGKSDPDVDIVSSFESAYGHGLVSGAASAFASGAASEVASLSDNESQMTMFHVVFVMNPPALEYHLRMDDMYDHVAKKFAKYLKHEQSYRNYVWDEATKILNMKEKAMEARMFPLMVIFWCTCLSKIGAPTYMLWPNVQQASTLAKAMTLVFDATSDSKIAHVNLDNAFDIAFQIPQPEATPFISTATEPQVPGLWLTTAPFTGDEESDPILNPHSALLLLEDGETLIKEIENDDKELSGPLAWFVRNVTPTKSLQKLFSNSSIAFNDSLFLARHLIYWRRARSIPPLHHRDTYIVSPNADMRALPAAITTFAHRFPTLPPLPKFLHLLSGPPRPYYMMMPTKDHRFAYMDILAWLMRGGWITQLKSFGWVSIPTKVKSAVAMKLAEELRRKRRPQKSLDQNSEIVADGSTSGPSTGHRSTESGSTTSLTTSPSGSSVTSPHLTAYRSPSHPSSDAGSISSERTTVLYRTLSPSPPQHHTLPLRPSPLHMEQQLSPEAEKAKLSPSALSSQVEEIKDMPAVDTSTSTPSIIHSPQKANANESRWIEYIGSSFTDPELAELWPIMLKYFDGKHALDEIALREGLKRKRVASVLARLKEGGCLLTVRHW